MPPRDFIPYGPAFDPRARRANLVRLWENYPLRTMEQIDNFHFSVIKSAVEHLGAHGLNVDVVDALDECLRELGGENLIHLPIFPEHYVDDPEINMHQELSQARIDAFIRFSVKTVLDFFQSLRAANLPESGVGTIPLIEALPTGRALAQISYSETFTTLVNDNIETPLFPYTYKNLERNLKTANGLHADDSVRDIRRLKQPFDSRLFGMELVKHYLGGTPWASFYQTQVPFEIPVHRRLEHTAIVAGSGAGKTQLLEAMILNDLKRDDPPGMIILDSTGQMTGRLQKLALFNERLRDRIVIIDPAHAPSLNMFDVFTPRFERYTADERENLQSEIVSLFRYVFASSEYDLTAQMGTAFAYAVRVILSIPGSTVNDLRRLLEENPRGGYKDSTFKPAIEAMGEDTIDFFAHHFFAQNLVGTRLSIARRIHNVVGVPAFRRMFTASSNALDLFEDMQRGAIVLVNTNEHLLQDSYVLFGRYIIARALAAAFERSTISPNLRRESYLIVDEAAPYFDQTFESLLTRVRQFRLGVVIAFQHLEQAPEKLKSAIASSTSVKFAARLGFADRRWLGREMETTPEFIQAQTQAPGDRPAWGQFAAFVRNHTPTAISLTIPFGALGREPQMSFEEHQQLLQRNHARVTHTVAPAIPAPVAPAKEPEPAAPVPDISPERESAPPPQAGAPPEATEPAPPPVAPKPAATPQPEDGELPKEWG
ncbi:MAG: type IV secretion system DNA-binding domain-containing protein [Alphaproteobacteria bacterium]|nr:type IV secretion system DNA-binding domain-containing protein [Alphaproteobacteria bacterium]MCW5741622.1 type IV secretion system DNA-binding domain-containing protein [Alphaproteobacteria bacterium]